MEAFFFPLWLFNEGGGALIKENGVSFDCAEEPDAGRGTQVREEEEEEEWVLVLSYTFNTH